MRWLTLPALLGVLTAGCSPTQPFVTPERLDKGLVLVLPGVHGRLWLSESICRGLSDGGVESAIEIYDWTFQGKLLPFYNLGAQDRNRAMARRIASRVLEYQNSYPDRPVVVVGYSGGGPIAVWVAEAMPNGAKLDGLILLSPPLAPEYDLAPALRASRNGIVNFHSEQDWLYLGLGTMVFGTMEGQHKVSAGKAGFAVPTSGPAAGAYRKVFQIAWRPEMARYGYKGTHLTSAAEEFVAAFVAPFVLSEPWDAALVDSVVRQTDAAAPTGP